MLNEHVDCASEHLWNIFTQCDMINTFGVVSLYFFGCENASTGSNVPPSSFQQLPFNLFILSSST